MDTQQTLVHFYEAEPSKLPKQLASEVELISELLVDSPQTSSLDLRSHSSAEDGGSLKRIETRGLPSNHSEFRQTDVKVFEVPACLPLVLPEITVLKQSKPQPTFQILKSHALQLTKHHAPVVVKPTHLQSLLKPSQRRVSPAKHKTKAAQEAKAPSFIKPSDRASKLREAVGKLKQKTRQHLQAKSQPPVQNKLQVANLDLFGVDIQQ